MFSFEFHLQQLKYRLLIHKFGMEVVKFMLRVITVV